MDLPELRFLYAYNRSANRRALPAAAQLAEEELTRDLGASYGSLVGMAVAGSMARSNVISGLNGDGGFGARLLGQTSEPGPRLGH